MSSDRADERRRFSRASFDVEGRIQFAAGDRAAGDMAAGELPLEILNLSLKGCRVLPRGNAEQIEIWDRLPFETKGKLLFTLPGSEVEIEAEAELVHREEGTVGFRFGVIDAESFGHIRRILELNTDDPERIDDELSFLIEN